MRNRRKEKLQEREYKVLFLLWETEKKVCAWISFSSKPEVELRKRWRSFTTASEQLLTEDGFCIKPEALMWKVGWVRREIAVYALQQWQTDFVEHGFQIVVRSENTVSGGRKPNLTRFEKNRVVGISVDALLQNREYWRVAYKDIIGKEKNPTEKFTADSATESLCIRVTEDVADAFRRFCRRNALTQSQAMANLLDQANGTSNENLLARDLTVRLNNADERLKKAKEEISRFQKALEREKQEKEYPKKYQAAMLQDQLLRTFFDRISSPKFPDMLELKRYSSKSSHRVFHDRWDYTYPERDGVVLLYLEHIAYGKQTYPPLFIYGIDEDGNKKKVRWYYKRMQRFGVSVWESRFLLAGTPWLFAVQKTGDVADVVGSLPVIDVNWSNIKTIEDILELQELIQAQDEYIDELEEELDGLQNEKQDSAKGNIGDNCTENLHDPLDEVLRKINEGKK